MIWPFETVDEETYRAFQQYHRTNPAIFAAFKKFAFEARGRKKRFGAKAVMERVRWELEINTTGSFKVNNDFTALYARLLIYQHPEFKNFFSLRTVTGLKRAKSIWRQAA